MTMIDEKMVEAAAIALGRIDGIELPWIADKAGAYWHDYKVRAELAITAYEAAKAQTLALLVTPDRGRRVEQEHPMAAKPVAEPVAGRLISDEPLEALAYARTTAANDDMTKPGTIERQRHCDRLAAMQAASDEIVRLRALSAPASKDGPDALRPD